MLPDDEAVTLELVRSGELSPLEWVRRVSTNPASIASLDTGTLRVGSRADVVLIDPERRWVYDASKGYSKSRNSPWNGRELVGRATHTWVEGRLAYDVEQGVILP